MRHQTPLRTLCLGLGAFMVLGMLAACAPEAEGADISSLLSDTDTTPTTPEQPTATEAAEVAPTDTPEATPTQDEHCIDCHTDQEILMSLATEAETGESLSSGEG